MYFTTADWQVVVRKYLCQAGSNNSNWISLVNKKI